MLTLVRRPARPAARARKDFSIDSRFPWRWGGLLCALVLVSGRLVPAARADVRVCDAATETISTSSHLLGAAKAHKGTPLERHYLQLVEDKLGSAIYLTGECLTTVTQLGRPTAQLATMLIGLKRIRTWTRQELREE